MESITIVNHEDHLTNPTQEVDPHEQDVAPGGRSYECIFCMHGFTTAQALGGHMNIHRKDRAKGRPGYLSNISNNQEDDSFYTNPRFYHPVSTSCPQPYTSKTSNNQEGNTRHMTSFSSMLHENNHQDCCGHIKSPPRNEKMMSLTLEFGWSHGEDDRESTTRNHIGSNDQDELDLELRLGHDPWVTSHIE